MSTRTVIATTAFAGVLALMPTTAFALTSSTTTAPPKATAPAPKTVAPKTAAAAPKVAAAAPKTYVVRAGSFRTKKSADRRMTKLTTHGVTGFAIVEHGTGARHRFRVQASGLSATDTKTVVKALKKFGIHVVVVLA